MQQQPPVLARIAAEAGSMQLGTNIFLLPIHNPVYVGSFNGHGARIDETEASSRVWETMGP